LIMEMANYLSLEKYLNNACNKIRSLAMMTKGDHFWGSLEAILFTLVQPLKKFPFINEDVSLLINTFGEVGRC
jgi:hypothetical protein